MAPVQTVLLFLGHTSPTKYYFHGSATEREQNVLSFRSREHNPGHLLEDLQNTSKETTVRTKVGESPHAMRGRLALLLATPLHKALMLSQTPKQMAERGSNFALGGTGVDMWGVITIPHLWVHAFILRGCCLGHPWWTLATWAGIRLCSHLKDKVGCSLGVWFISIERERLGGENVLGRGKNISRALGCVWLSRCVGGARGLVPGCTGYLQGTSLEAQVLLQERLVQQAKDCPTENTHDTHRCPHFMVCKLHCISVTASDLLSTL